MGLEPLDGWESLIYGIDTLVARSVAALAEGGAVEHHETFLGYGGLHPRRLADDGEVDIAELGEDALDATTTADLLLCRGGEDERIGAFVGEADEIAEGGEQADERATGIVAAEAVESSVLNGWRKGVAGVACGGFDCVDMGVEEDDGLACGTGGFARPDIVALAVDGQPPSRKLLLEEIGYGCLVAADGGGGDHPLEEVDTL